MERVEIENLRGFKRVAIDMTHRSRFLVGPNNAGKTSLLRILDWSLNRADAALLTGARGLSDQEARLLLPAADAAGRARRISIRIRVSDLRVARGFRAKEGVAQLRLKVSSRSVSAHLGPPRRGEPSASDPKAIELLELLRQSEQWLYVPNVRDTNAGAFRDQLRSVVLERLKSSMLPAAQGRPAERVRHVRNALDSLRERAEEELVEVIEEFSQESRHLFNRAELRLAFEHDDALGWLADAVALRLTTGAHDSRMVPVEEVGSGLQSLLVIGLLKGVAQGQRRVRLLLEEPETFLHPSAQRELARSLLDNDDLWFIASTHSAAMIDEATVSDVIIVRDHRLFAAPAATGVDDRQSAYMSGRGAEALFARSVLLVEGAGDVAAFEEIRRRLARHPALRPACSQMTVIAVGGKTAFTPWIRLLRGFSDQERRQAIRWLVCADGDAATQVIKCLNQAGLEVPEAVRSTRANVDASYAARDQLVHPSAVREFNGAAVDAGVGVHLLPFDLEFALMNGMSTTRAAEVGAAIGVDAQNGEELAHKLGSKCRPAAAKGASKADVTRREVARVCNWTHLDHEMQWAIGRWLQPVLSSQEHLSLASEAL
ncbi:ATP-dependent nuclease [Nocardioides aequoreus]|uniref:ATP-dependent nuclease n=1 Tax=Nocardioides aequoreus TaxID=397278 RepID=UPI00147064A2|nr:AAA family ATPase [Nocardioides aequoreus]